MFIAFSFLSVAMHHLLRLTPPEKNHSHFNFKTFPPVKILGRYPVVGLQPAPNPDDREV
jgi:hypothetical protein